MNFDYNYFKKILCECFGCFVLTFFGCGTAVGTGDPAAIAIVFGFVIISMAYSIGPISGCHINPAVSLGMVIVGRLPIIDFIFYVIGQFIGAIIAGFLLLAVISCSKEFDSTSDSYGLGENGLAYLDWEESVHGINVGGGILLEIIMSFVFITVIIINTRKNSPTGNLAGIIIGCTLTILIATGLNFTGTSVNPARSFGPALALIASKNYHAIAQYWVFLLSPLIGGFLGALFCRFILQTEVDTSKSTVGSGDEDNSLKESPSSTSTKTLSSRAGTGTGTGTGTGGGGGGGGGGGRGEGAGRKNGRGQQWVPAEEPDVEYE